MRVFSIDVETTGLCPKAHSIIEMGAISFDLADASQPVHYFHRYCIPNGMNWDMYCLHMHREVISMLLKKTIPDSGDIPYNIPKQIPRYMLFKEFCDWLVSIGWIEPKDRVSGGRTIYEGEPKRVVPAGKNFNGFDKQFIQNLSGFREVFTHRSLDPGFSFIEPGDEVPPDLKACKIRATKLGCPDLTDSVAHTAIEDATDVMKLLQFAHSNRSWK